MTDVVHCRVSEAEARMAVKVGGDRHVDKIFHPQRDRFVLDRDQWALDIEAAAAELAVAKALGLYWVGANDLNRAKTDAGPFQVKHTTTDSLIVWPSAPDDEIFVMVTGCIPTFEIVGWLYAREAKRTEWLRQLHGPGSLAHFAPRHVLHDIDRLRLVIDAALRRIVDGVHGTSNGAPSDEPPPPVPFDCDTWFDD